MIEPLREPTVEEKERLMGYLDGVTAKEITTGVWLSEMQRSRLIGNVWDAIAIPAHKVLVTKPKGPTKLTLA